eukprot:symbB.v1.2.038647.t1/scaffold6097.1/size20952/2
MACAPHRDHRYTQVPGFAAPWHPGASHGRMQIAGFEGKPQEPKIVTPRMPARALDLPPTLRSVAPSNVDHRFLPGCGLQMTVGLEWRRRRTQELDASRGVGGGIAYANVADMRPAGVTRQQQSDVCLRGWHVNCSACW